MCDPPQRANPEALQQEPPDQWHRRSPRDRKLHPGRVNICGEHRHEQCDQAVCRNAHDAAQQQADRTSQLEDARPRDQETRDR
jgi:hypothetical protein